MTVTRVVDRHLIKDMADSLSGSNSTHGLIFPHRNTRAGSRTRLKAVEPLIQNVSWVKVWNPPFRDLGRSAPIAGHPSGTRPISDVA